MDRIMIQRQFRKAWWICSCGQEDFTDLNVGTPSTYEHNCSACSKWSNKFKEYQGVLSYDTATYDTIKEKDIEKDKTDMINKWVYDVKNPTPEIEPTKEVLKELRDRKQAEVDELQSQIDAKEVEIGR